MEEMASGVVFPWHHTNEISPGLSPFLRLLLRSLSGQATLVSIVFLPPSPKGFLRGRTPSLPHASWAQTHGRRILLSPYSEPPRSLPFSQAACRTDYLPFLLHLFPRRRLVPPFLFVPLPWYAHPPGLIRPWSSDPYGHPFPCLDPNAPPSEEATLPLGTRTRRWLPDAPPFFKRYNWVVKCGQTLTVIYTRHRPTAFITPHAPRTRFVGFLGFLFFFSSKAEGKSIWQAIRA